MKLFDRNGREIDLEANGLTVVYEDSSWFMNMLAAIPWWGWLTIFAFFFTAFLMWLLPVYNVWASRKSGEAALEEAKKAEQVLIQEAQAEKTAAIELKEAELTRASAVSESMAIIGESLKQNQEYLTWQWIKQISDNDNIIYIPTEAGLPILEAGRIGMPKQED